MKKGVSILLLLLYLTASFRMVLPYLNYSVNKEKIATLFCKNKGTGCEGTCYLRNELNKAGEDSKKTGTFVFENERAYSTSPASFVFDSILFFVYNVTVFPPLDIFYAGTYWSDIFHPPSVI